MQSEHPGARGPGTVDKHLLHLRYTDAEMAAKDCF